MTPVEPFKVELDRYRFSVVAVAARLASITIGSSDPRDFPESFFEHQWLRWRLGPEGWVPCVSGQSDDSDAARRARYQDAVHLMASAALDLYRRGRP